jgi:hypothetical protein
VKNNSHALTVSSGLFFVENTGKTVDRLWAGYVKAQGPKNQPNPSATTI